MVHCLTAVYNPILACGNSRFPSAGPHVVDTLKAELSAEASLYAAQAYAVNTCRTYATHRRSYLAFCHVMGVAPVPADTTILCQYATLLARTLKFSSVKQYLNVVRNLHLEWNLPNPLSNNFHLQSVLRGIRRVHGDQPCRKAPITPDLLLQFLGRLDMSNLADCCLWSCMLLTYYGLLRIASVLCTLPRCAHTRHITAADITLHSGGVEVIVRATKTIQYGQRHLVVPLPRVPGNVLCPTQALALYLERSGLWGVSSRAPLFVVTPAGKPLTANDFRKRVKDLLARSDCDTSLFGGHSFRRGGACLAYRLGIPIDTIRTLGDWASNAYTAYILPEKPLLTQAISLMVRGASPSLGSLQ